MPFFRPIVVGRENLPPTDKPVIYVANHQSFMDIYTLCWLDIPIKFIAKSTIFYIPVAGWVMGLIGHVAYTRGEVIRFL
jgi:1-acyl-sn-glycerol-3-phosphate acyltransferase